MDEDPRQETPEAPRGRPRWLRWLRRLGAAVVGLVLGVVVLVLLVLAVLQTEWARDLVREQVVSLLNGSLEGTIAVEDLEGNFVRHLRVEGVTVLDPEGREALSVEALEVTWSPWRLLAGEVLVDDVRLVRPRMTLTDRQGRMALARAFASKQPSPPSDAPPPDLRIVVEHASLERGHVAMAPGREAMAVSELELGGGVEMELRSGAIAWSRLAVAGQTHGVPVPSVAIVSEGRLDSDAVTVDHLAVRAGPHRLRVEGAVRGLKEQPRLDVVVKDGFVDLDALGASLGQPDLRGRATLSGSATGPLSDLEAHLELDTSGGRVELDAEADLEGEPLVWELTLRGEDLEPHAVMASMEPGVGATLRLEASGRGDPTAEGRAEAELTIEQTQGVPDVPLPLVATASMAEGALHAKVEAREGDRMLLLEASAPHLPPGPVEASWEVRGISLAPWAELAGQEGLHGVVELLRGSAQAHIPEQGAPAVRVDTELRASRLVVPESMGAEASVVGLDVRADLTWPGEGLPTGRADVAVSEARVAGLEGVEETFVEDLRLRARLGETEAGMRADGELRVADARYGDQGRLGEAAVPFDLVLGEDGLPERGRAAVHLERARFQDIRAASADVRARVRREDDGTLHVSGPLEVEGFQVEGTASLRSVRSRLDATLLPDGTLEAGVDLQLHGVNVGGQHAASSVDGDVRVRVPGGDAGRLMAVGSLDLQEVRSGPDLRAEHASVTFDAAMDGAIPTGRVAVRISGGELGGKPLERASADVHLTRQGPSRARVHVQQEDRTALADLVLDGPLDPSQPIVARVERLKMVAGDAGFRVQPGATVTIEPDTGELIVRDLRIHDMGEERTSLAASLRYVGETGAISGEVEGEDIPIDAWIQTIRRFGVPLLPGRDLAGTLSIDGEISGTLRAPLARVQVRLEGVHFAPFQDLDALVALRIQKKATAVRVEASWEETRRVELTASAEAPLSLEGGLPLEMDTPVKLKAKLVDVRLEDFSEMVPQATGAPLAGLVGGRIEVEGTLADPRAVVDLALEEFAFGPIEDARAEVDVVLLESATRANVSYHQAQEEVLWLKAAMPVNLVAAVTAATDKETLRERLRDQDVVIEARVAPTSLGDFPYTSGLGPLRDAVLAMNLEVLGTLGAPDMKGFVRLRKVPLGTSTVAVHATVDTRDADLRLWVDATSGGLELVGVEALLPKATGLLLSGDDVLSILQEERLRVVATSRLPVDALATLSPAASRQAGNFVADGVFTASVVLSGGAEERGLSVRAALESLRPQQPLEDLGLAAAIRVAAHAGPDGTEVSLVLDQESQGGHMMLDGKLALTVDELLAGRVGPEVPMEAVISSEDVRLVGLATALPQIFGPSEGVLNIRTDISGTLGTPVVEGRLAMHFDELDLAVTGYEQEDVTLALAFDRDSLRLVPLHLEHGDGTLDLKFSLDFGGFDPAQMNMDGSVVMDGFRLLDRRDMQATVTSDVQIGGTLALPSISGRITVDEGTLSPDMGQRNVQSIGTPDDVVFASNLDQDAKPGERKSAAVEEGGGIDLDLTVDLPPRHLRVRNDMADILLAGDLQVHMSGDVVTIQGMIEVVEGKVELYGRKFELSDESRVIFTGSRELNPRLDITATFDISDVDLAALGMTASADSKIMVRVTGTAQNPQIELRSDPPMDETNIVSIITVGHPVGGGDEQAVESQVTNLFVGLALGPATRFVTEKLPVDVFEVRTGGEGGLTQAQIRAGTRLTKDLMVLYDANLGAQPEENVNELRIEYTITGALKLETYFGDAGEGGLELVLRRRY